MQVGSCPEQFKCHVCTDSGPEKWRTNNFCKCPIRLSALLASRLAAIVRLLRRSGVYIPITVSYVGEVYYDLRVRKSEERPWW